MFSHVLRQNASRAQSKPRAIVLENLAGIALVSGRSDYGLLPRDPDIAALSTKVGEFMRRFLLRPHRQHRARPRTPRCTEGRMQRNRQCGCPRAGRSAAAMPMLWRSHDHHRDLRARQRRPRAAIGRLRKQDWRVMTANGPSPHRNPAEEPPRRRPDVSAPLRPVTRFTPSAALRSSALQRPHRNVGGPGAPRLPVNAITRIDQTGHHGPVGHRRKLKSP